MREVNGYVTVPDWIGGDNARCGIAAARWDDADAVVMLAVTVGTDPERAAFAVGTELDAKTAVAADWTQWQDVPDWTPSSNQGADIAVGNLTGGNQQDLFVLRVDGDGVKNTGRYRIGRDLRSDGTVNGGWTPWRDVPDWFSTSNQGVGIAVGDTTGSGRPDLIVFVIDNPDKLNRAVYRIGRELMPDGTVSADWSGWVDVPDWFSWENAGGGVALADLDGNGKQDLIVFGIDNPPGPKPPPTADPSGQNQAFYRVAHGIIGNGIALGGWSPLLGINNWPSWNNQDGALTVLGSGKTARLLVAAVDAPPGATAGFYAPVLATETPQTHGSWQELEYGSGVLAVHAALLHTGKVLFFAGSGNSPIRAMAPDFGAVGKGFWTSVVWDPGSAAFAHPATIKRDDGRPFDFFCGGDTFLADGKVFSAGGNQDYTAFGQHETAAFDPDTEQWERRASMSDGRWYPSLLTLADGTILTVSGQKEQPPKEGEDNHNEIIECYRDDADGWKQLNPPQPPFRVLPFYAHLFLLAGGRVFFDGGRMDDDASQSAGILDLAADPIGFQPVRSMVPPELRNQSSSVLLPPAQDQQVMIIGGGPGNDSTSATGCVERFDLRADEPAGNLEVPLSLPRMHLNAVLLPDRTVFVSGGAIRHEMDNVPPVPRLQSEIYDPETDTWRPAATAGVVRMYHSVALLLPDGRVVTAGGNPPPYGGLPQWVEQPNEELKLEVYSPPYLFAGTRPRIAAVQEQWHYGESVTVGSAEPDSIRWAELIRPGVTTHAFDNAQRLVDLPIRARRQGELDVDTPADGNIAPPGWYMLFLVNEDRIPSTATWICLQ